MLKRFGAAWIRTDRNGRFADARHIEHVELPRREPVHFADFLVEKLQRVGPGVEVFLLNREDPRGQGHPRVHAADRFVTRFICQLDHDRLLLLAGLGRGQDFVCGDA